MRSRIYNPVVIAFSSFACMGIRTGMDVAGLVEQMTRDGAFQEVLNNPGAQFGTATEPFLGAELLPEQNRDQLEYTEEGIRYRTMVANDGTRYSETQAKKGVLVGSFAVRLGHSDIRSEFTSAEYDALVRILRASGNGVPASPQAMSALVGWFDKTVNRPLLVKNEKMRWEAIVDALVPRRGNDNFSEDVALSDPTGHRVNVASDWDTQSYDPYAGDVLPMVAFLKSKGFTVNRIIWGTPVATKFAANQQVRARLGLVAITGGVVAGLAGSASESDIARLFQRDGLPVPETYDATYNTETATNYYLKRDCMVFACTTARDESVVVETNREIPLRNTLGYTAIGPAAGSAIPGRQTFVWTRNRKPPAVMAEGWQASFPVILEPEAIGVLKNIV